MRDEVDLVKRETFRGAAALGSLAIGGSLALFPSNSMARYSETPIAYRHDPDLVHMEIANFLHNNSSYSGMVKGWKTAKDMLELSVGIAGKQIDIRTTYTNPLYPLTCARYNFHGSNRTTVRPIYPNNFLDRSPAVYYANEAIYWFIESFFARDANRNTASKIQKVQFFGLCSLFAASYPTYPIRGIGNNIYKKCEKYLKTTPDRRKLERKILVDNIKEFRDGSKYDPEDGWIRKRTAALMAVVLSDMHAYQRGKMHSIEEENYISDIEIPIRELGSSDEFVMRGPPYYLNNAAKF